MNKIKMKSFWHDQTCKPIKICVANARHVDDGLSDNYCKKLLIT